MRVGIVGLGLIGASIAKALTNNKSGIFDENNNKSYYEVYAADKNEKVVSKAIEEKVISNELTDDNIKECELIIIALYPRAVIEYVNDNLNNFAEGTIIIDTAGIKSKIMSELQEKLAQKGVEFIGGHPMAGIEKSGYENSFPELFRDATMILCYGDNSHGFDKVTKVIEDIGFSNINITDAKTHDEVIAYTSQLAHILSSAYVKSPARENRFGFSAGSFKDLTRVAKMNEGMWAEIFVENKDYLTNEIDILIKNLEDYKNAIKSNNEIELRKLLKEGTDLKIKDEELN
ncbi:MAG: prephenate dehydrogenase [Anaerovoracaceae bacterium]